MKIVKIALGILLCGSTLSSCFKDTYDAPPDTSNTDPNLPVNVTLGALSNIAVNTLQSFQSRVLGDSTISGIVVADDRSGNFYKQIVIQDSTGGMMISIAQTYLYNDFPVGRRVYIKLKGLTLFVNYGVPVIGLSAQVVNGRNTLTGIPSAVIANYVIKGKYPNPVVSTHVRMNDLFGNPNKYLNTLITLDSMEFDAASAGIPYAGIIGSSSHPGTNRTIKECPGGNSMIMYNSSYAWFQPNLTPTGRGPITGVVSIFSGSPQLLIRDTTDVQLTGSRVCP